MINMVPLLISVVVLVCAGVVFNELAWFLFYPVFISVFFLILFGFSLKRPPNLIERMAITMGETSSPQLTRYTIKVAWVWCTFFLLNAILALYTATVASIEVWTLYNGLISYFIMGVIFTVEYIVRPKNSPSSEL
jgi:uncharacterized membrane protein